jgi:hypothetical protein
VMYRLAIDPSLLSAGAALMSDDRIVQTQRFTPELSNAEPIGARCLNIAAQVLTWSARGNTLAFEVIFEWPQHYDSRAGKTKGNPKNLTPLAGIGMAVVGALFAQGRLIRVVTPMPAQWIGQLPKTCAACNDRKRSCKVCRGSTWRTPRGGFIQRNLTASELDLVPDQHDVIDACGIGLWRVGRLRQELPGLVIS